MVNGPSVLEVLLYMIHVGVKKVGKQAECQTDFGSSRIVHINIGPASHCGENWMDGWMDGCMDGLRFYVILIVFQTYQDDWSVIMKGCVQWNPASSGANPDPLDHQARAQPAELPGLR